MSRPPATDRLMRERLATPFASARDLYLSQIEWQPSSSARKSVAGKTFEHGQSPHAPPACSRPVARSKNRLMNCQGTDRHLPAHGSVPRVMDVQVEDTTADENVPIAQTISYLLMSRDSRLYFRFANAFREPLT